MSNKRSNTLLENEINRYRSIMSYNDNTINETVYSFYKRATDKGSWEKMMRNLVEKS